MRSPLILVAFATTVGLACSPAGGTQPAPPALTTIVITGSISPIVLGVVPTLQLTASGLDQNNTPFPATFTWSSSDVSKAPVSGSGLVTIVAVGSVSIKAESQGVSRSVTIEIIPLPPAPKASAVILDDVTNNGNAGDVEVSFERAGDETKLSEYRVIIVKTAKASGFLLSEANAAGATRYLAIAKTSQNVKVTLPTDALDSDGDAILEGTSYTAFVLSVADGVNAKDNALSSASNAVKIAPTTVKITFVGDDGVVITDGAKTVIIDAMPPSFSVVINQITTSWIPAAAGLVSAIQNGTPPYDNISVAMVTHDHLDHWAIASTGSFLASHPQAQLIGPPQVVSNFPGNGQVSPLNPALFQSGETTIDGIRIKAFRMVHFSNFGLDFSSVQNLAFLVEIGGKKILHLGDADYTNENFAPFDFVNENVDVVILPAATFKLNAANIGLVRTLIAADNIIAAHLETSMTAGQVKVVWGDDVAVFTQSLQFLRY
ncbi:MAG: hypothetical protein HOP28_12110 [Gemmatimonadales bacterium]|nr:hypothetical protein [Gemmatimonadales bacterium]